VVGGNDRWPGPGAFDAEKKEEEGEMRGTLEGTKKQWSMPGRTIKVRKHVELGLKKKGYTGMSAMRRFDMMEKSRSKA